ncbi:MAG: ribosome-associated translation inhibitor RaiA [Neisseriaceae bacterium]|nr:MAG: ribosome-associated translation inhibitor RaiA [Neisseriaceae bacterium]
MKNLSILCKDFDLTDAIKDYATEKLSALDKYLPSQGENADFNLRLGKVSNHHHHGKIFYAEVSIKTPEKNFGALVEAEDIYAAIDQLKDDLAHNIAHYKDKAHKKDIQSARKFKQELQTSAN